jgi:predicted permease
MAFYLLKLLVSAALVVLVSEVVIKRTGYLGGLLASLPLVSLLAIGWIWFETHDTAKIADFSRGVFWFVLPSLLFFLVLPWSLPRLGFYPSLALACLVTMAGYAAMATALHRAGITP